MTWLLLQVPLRPPPLPPLPAPAADAAPGSLIVYVTLAIAIITPVAAAIKALSDRRTKRERNASSAHMEAQGAVLATGTPLEWRQTDHQALLDERAHSKALQTSLTEALEEVRTLADLLAEADRKMDGLASRQVAQAEDMRQLRASIAACVGGPPCPLRPAGAAR